MSDELQCDSVNIAMELKMILILQHNVRVYFVWTDNSLYWRVICIVGWFTNKQCLHFFPRSKSCCKAAIYTKRNRHIQINNPDSTWIFSGCPSDIHFWIFGHSLEVQNRSDRRQMDVHGMYVLHNFEHL